MLAICVYDIEQLAQLTHLAWYPNAMRKMGKWRLHKGGCWRFGGSLFYKLSALLVQILKCVYNNPKGNRVGDALCCSKYTPPRILTAK